MGTPSKTLRLAKPGTDDDFDTAEFADNWQKIDDAPGRFICDSLHRPSDWGSDQQGRGIWEIDTSLPWTWDGSDFEREGPVGLLNGVQRTSDFSTSNGSPQTVLSCPIVYPDGGRQLKIWCTWPKAESDIGVVEMTIFRGATKLQDWKVTGKTSPPNAYQEGTGSSIIVPDLPPSPGNYTYTFKLNVPTGYAGTAYLRAAADKPLSLYVEEI